MAAGSPNDNGTNKRFWTPGRIVITLVAVGLISAFGLSSCNSNETPATNAPTNRVVITSAPANRANTTAPPVTSVAVPANVRDTTFKTLNGESAKLSDYSNKVVVVNMWATWCGPCRQEIPELVKMSNEYKARGLVVLGLATTYNENRRKNENRVDAQRNFRMEREILVQSEAENAANIRSDLGCVRQRS